LIFFRAAIACRCRDGQQSIAGLRGCLLFVSAGRLACSSTRLQRRGCLRVSPAAVRGEVAAGRLACSRAARSRNQ